MLVCEVVVLVLGPDRWRSCARCAAPVFFPLRLLATVYVDLFRGLPLLLVLLLLGFGCPGARPHRRCRTTLIVSAAIALVLTYSRLRRRGVPRRHRVVHPCQRAAARALGLSHAQSHAVRRAAAGRAPGRPRRCSTTSSRCRRTPALVSIARRRRRDPRGPDLPPRGLQLHAVRRRRARLRRPHRADGAADRLGGPRARAGPASGGTGERRGRAGYRPGAARPARPRRRAPAQGVRRRTSSSTTSTSTSRRADVRRAHRRLRVGQVDAAALRRPARAGRRRRRSASTGQDITDPRVDADAVRRPDRHRLPGATTSSRTSTVLANVTLAPVRVHRWRATRPRRAGARGCSTGVGLRDKAARPARRPVRRPAAAGRHRPGAGHRPRLLLLDEVTAALDPELVGEVLDLLRELKAEGTTMVLATHEMGFARQVADQVCFLDAGRILEQGPAGAGHRRPAGGAHPALPVPPARLTPAGCCPGGTSRSRPTTGLLPSRDVDVPPRP